MEKMKEERVIQGHLKYLELKYQIDKDIRDRMKEDDDCINAKLAAYR